ERIRIGHGVTDPVLFHPAVIAGATATIRELAGDRVFVGLGTGGPYGKPYVRAARLAELEEAVRFVKAYSAGDEASFAGGSWHSEWIRRSPHAGRALEVSVPVGGPRMCRMAGRVADAALSVGMDLTLQTWRKHLVDS